MAELLNNNPIALRHCLLYEFLRVKSVGGLENETFSLFAKYNDFCKVIGYDAMKYSEFEFWFYRFLNGEYDLTHERNEDKKIYELADMPLDVLSGIVGYLNIFDRLALARTSRSFKAFVEDQKSFHKELRFRIDIDSAGISFENKWIRKREDDCYRSSRESASQEKLIKGVPCWKQAIHDLEIILRLPKLHFEKLFFNLFDHGPLSEDNLKTLDEVADELETLKIQQFHVEDIFFQARDIKPLLKILPNLKPGYLTTIQLSVPDPKPCDLEELVQMEQWKQAKCFTKYASLFEGFWRHLYHFEKLKLGSDILSVEDIRQIREILLKSSNLENFTIKIYDSVDMDVIQHEFGNAIRENPDTSTYTFHLLIPNSMEYFEIDCMVDFENWPHEIKITRKKK